MTMSMRHCSYVYFCKSCNESNLVIEQNVKDEGYSCRRAACGIVCFFHSKPYHLHLTYGRVGDDSPHPVIYFTDTRTLHCRITFQVSAL